MKPETTENFLDELILTQPVLDNFSVCTFMCSAAARLGADICYTATKSSEYSEANKRLTRIQLQLEHYEKRFTELSEIFKTAAKGIDFSAFGNYEQITELLIDFLKHTNEIIAMIRTVAEFSDSHHSNEIYTSANLIKSATENILYTIKSIIKKNEAEKPAENVVYRSKMLSEDIFNSANKVFSILQKEDDN